MTQRPIWVIRMANTGGTDNRQGSRQGIFRSADLRIDGVPGDYCVTIRNLSSGGVMAEGNVSVMRGSALSIMIEGMGWVNGTVAWIQDTRFGIAFTSPLGAGAEPAQAEPANA